MQWTSPRSGTEEKGFTLMELVIVMGIVGMVLTSATDIFMMVSRAQRKIFALEKTQADARFTLEAMAREARSGMIDYPFYLASSTAVPAPTEDLALVDSYNTKMRFRKSGAGEESLCADADSAPCLLMSIAGGSEAPLTPKGVVVRNVKFYIGPTRDPFDYVAADGGYAANEQPHVTIVLMLEGKGTRPEENSIVYAQTTVTSRASMR